MPTISLKAHFDGSKIVLDEPYSLLPNSALMVTVLPLSAAGDDDIDEATWLRAVAKSDAFDFLADPAEDVYTLNDGEPLTNEI
jgi:hypothetical protein